MRKPLLNLREERGRAWYINEYGHRLVTVFCWDSAATIPSPRQKPPIRPACYSRPCFPLRPLHPPVKGARLNYFPGLFYGGEADARVVGEEDFVSKVLPRKKRAPKPPSLPAIVAHVCASASMREGELLAPGKSRPAAHARALIGWLAARSKAATLTAVAARFHRDLSTLSHAISVLQERSRNSARFANTLIQHLYAIYQA